MISSVGAVIIVLLYVGFGLNVLSGFAGFSGCVCLIVSHSSSVLQLCPFAPLSASSSAALFPLSLLCPFMCSNLISLVSLTCCKRVLAVAARYLLLSGVFSCCDFGCIF